MYYIPIIGSLALAWGTIFEKIILRKKKIGIQTFHLFSFIALFIIMLPLIFFFWEVKPGALQITNLALMFLVVVFSIAANLLVYYSLKWDKVTNLEPAKMVEPLFVVLLALLFSFVYEEHFDRNFNIIIPALIAGGALVFSHIKKHHLEFNKYFLAAVAGSFLFAVELVLSKFLLDFYSPLSLYFVRVFFIIFFSFFILKPKFKTLNKRIKLQIFGIAIIWVVYRIVVYYGYIQLGVTFTTLMMMLSPLFIYAFAWKYLKEKLDWKNITAAVIILGCIFYVLIFP